MNFKQILSELMVPQNRDYEMTDRERISIFKDLRRSATSLSGQFEKYKKDKDFEKYDQEAFSKCEELMDQVRKILFDAE